MKPSPVLLLGLGALSAHAASINLNFTDNGSADSTMATTDIAGAPGVASANWNNLDVTGTGPASGGSINYDNGTTASGVSVSWNSDLGNWRLGHSVSDGHDRMWKGYLDTNASSTVDITGLTFVGTYDVYIYFDGDNGSAWRVANFSIGAASASGEDSENTSWGFGQNSGEVYQIPLPGSGGNQPFPTSPNNNEGNYVVFSGVSGSAFTLNITSGATGGGTRAPVNGIQIVGVVPEPSVTLLGGLGALCLLRRRRS